MKLALARKTFAIFGYKASGKSTLAKFIAETYKTKCLYFDTLKECPADVSFHSYKPKTAHNPAELDAVVSLLKSNHRYRMFIIDEANRYCPPKPTPLKPNIADMNDWCRHPEYNLAVGYIARRPVQINSDLIELCDYLFIFQLGGKNDIKYLNDLRTGLGETVKNLPLYHYVIVKQDRTWSAMKPIKPGKSIIGSDTRNLTIRS